MDLAFHVVSTLPHGIAELARVASAEGCGMVRRLVDDYTSGANAFSKQGERLCVALNGEAVSAIGGRNVDPYFDSASLGRIRHVYVHPGFRRAGVGARLMRLIEEGAEAYFESFQLFTESAVAARFYEALDYSPVEGRSKVTHAKWIGA